MTQTLHFPLFVVYGINQAEFSSSVTRMYSSFIVSMLLLHGICAGNSCKPSSLHFVPQSVLVPLLASLGEYPHPAQGDQKPHLQHVLQASATKHTHRTVNTSVEHGMLAMPRTQTSAVP